MTDTAPANSRLLPDLLEAGGVATEYHGQTLVRHFGDPSGEYDAATHGVAVFDRSHRARLTVTGRAPGQMLSGVLTGRMPDMPSCVDEVSNGAGTYHAVLTPKGKMISDLWAYRLGDAEVEAYLLDVPVAGREGLRAHFGRFLPPRFAAVREVSEETASVSVVGPDAAAALSRLALGLRVEASTLSAANEGSWYCVGGAALDDNGSLERLIVSRTGDVWPDAWTVYGPGDAVRALWAALIADGATPAGLGVWGTLRVEAGRPVFGTDMDENTLPPEAGIVERAVDQTKGCYTGQEVIVRIRDRGHVNRHLRVLELGDIPAPARGAELLAGDGSGKVVGHLTSVVQSPRSQGVLAMGYVRRGVTEALLGDRTVHVPVDD
mgnify:CR=1 FL=1